MILVSQPRAGVPSLSFGHRRSITSPEYRVFDLPLNGRESGLAPTAGSGADRLLHMSGTSPLPLRTAHGHGIINRGEAPVLYAAPPPSDGFRSNPSHPQPAVHRREPPAAPVYHVSRAYPSEHQASPYSHHSHEDPTRLTTYGLQTHHGTAPQGGLHPAYLPSSGAVLTETSPGLNRPPASDGHPHTSPRSQRKTKGHVASACVPCKKAHLRCDTTRPCSRCIGSGKEDACIDVQHKKRGRPRLRDESSRFDPSRYSHSQDPSRRPLSIYPSGPMEPSACDDHLRRGPAFGLRDPRTSELPLRHFHHERLPPPETSVVLYGQHASTVQPLAYLNIEFEVIKASPTFLDAVRMPHIVGRKFSDLVVPSHVGMVHALQGQVINEQRSREPNYLPPIMGSGLVDSVIQQLGYGADDATRYPLLRQEYFSFMGSDNMTRTLPVRLGLAKGESHYFVAVLLNLQPPPAQSQYARDRPVNYHPLSTPPQSVFGEPVSNPPTYDPRRQRFSEGSIQLPSSLSSSSSGMESTAPTLASAVTRPDYPGQPAYPAFRGDATSTSRSSSHSFQLPPIRTRTDPRSSPREHEVSRNERPSRVDIGGLIEKQSSSERHW